MSFMTTSLGVDSILPPEYGALITDPLEAEALAFRPQVATTTRLAEHGVLRIPRVVSDAAAQWVEEGQEIATSEPTLDEITVIPTKVAGLVPTSRELANDSNPGAMDIVGRSLARAIRDQIDAAFTGDLAAPAPSGLASLTDGINVIESGPLTDLDPIYEARAAVESAGGSATVVLVNPADALALRKVKESDSSSRGLLDTLDTLDGVPVIRHAGITAGQLWVIDNSAVYTALREDVEIAISDGPYFTSDRIAIRATARVGIAFPYPGRLARIDVTAA
ncbi:hypothetical protein GCM10009625_27260 [Brachybacterium fresconis]